MEGEYKYYKTPKEVKELYSKPKTHEELVERMKILKEIPEDRSIPKVVIKLGSPEKSHKFDIMTDKEGRIYLIALPIEKRGYHGHIYEFSEKLYNKKLNIIGGGYIFGNPKTNEILIEKSSVDYGFVPKWKVKEILEQKFPDIKIKVDSENGDLMQETKKVLESDNLESALSLSSREVLEEIFSNKKLVKKLIQKKPYLLKYAFFTNLEKDILDILDNEEIVRSLIEKDPRVFQFVSDRLKDNKEMVKFAVKRLYQFGLQFASDRLKNDKEIQCLAF